MNAWDGTLDFGVVHPLVFLECRLGEGPVLETLDTIIADGAFGAVEIAPVKQPGVRRAAQALLGEAGLQVVYLPILPNILGEVNLGHADPERRAAALEQMRGLLDEAISFDASLAMIGPPPDPGPAGRSAMAARLAEDIAALCDYADARSQGRRLILTLENFDREIEKRRLIGPTVEAAALAEAIDRPNFGLTLDLSHLPLLGETAAEAVAAAGPHLVHAHIGSCVVANRDSPLYGDFHPRFGHPDGANDVPEVVEYLQALHDAGFWQQARRRLGGTPILSMELRPSDGDTSASILENGKRVFAEAWQHVATS